MAGDGSPGLVDADGSTGDDAGDVVAASTQRVPFHVLPAAQLY